MSAIDVLRSFAETHCGDHEVVPDGVTYGVCREAVSALARKGRVIAILAWQIARCPLDAGCDLPDSCACLVERCDAHKQPTIRRRKIESGCWLAWAEAEADKEAP